MTQVLKLGAVFTLIAALFACETTGDGDGGGKGGKGGDDTDTTVDDGDPDGCVTVYTGSCPENTHCEDLPEGAGAPYTCACDEAYYGTGYNSCFLREVPGGECDMNEALEIVCTCDPGYVQIPMTAGCTDVNECETPDKGGCEAWCTNTEGSFECESTVSDETSPYWTESCDPYFSHTSDPTDLPVDCRCGWNKMPVLSGGLEICQRPSSVSPSVGFGTGPSLRELVNLRTYAGAFDQADRKLFVGVGWTDPGNAYRGEIVEVDADTGNRRVLSGTWPGRFDWEEYGEGPFLDEVQNLALGPNGDLFAWTRSQAGTAQIVAVDRVTGDRELIWREHTAYNEPLVNDPAWGQCPNGSALGRQIVQIWERGLLVEPDGSFLLTVVSNNAAAQTTPRGIVRISPDGSTCEWVTRYGMGAENTLTPIGGGYQSQVQFTNMFWVNGMIWAYDTFATVWQIDPSNGDRRIIMSDLALDWLSWDAERQGYWVSGAGGGANNIQIWFPDDESAFDISIADQVYEVKGNLYGPLGGPAETCCQNHLPTHHDPLDGNLFVWHDVFGLLKLEIETGNSYIFSL